MIETNYRPQWVYFTPPGFRDEDYRYVVSFPLVANGLEQANFQVQLDDDAPFVLRGIWWPGGATATECRIRDPWGNYLMSDYCLNGGGLLLTGPQTGSSPVAVESEIICPAGSFLTFDFWPSTNGFNTAFNYVGELRGVKRFEVCQ